MAFSSVIVSIVDVKYMIAEGLPEKTPAASCSLSWPTGVPGRPSG